MPSIFYAKSAVCRPFLGDPVDESQLAPVPRYVAKYGDVSELLDVHQQPVPSAVMVRRFFWWLGI